MYIQIFYISKGVPFCKMGGFSNTQTLFRIASKWMLLNFHSNGKGCAQYNDDEEGTVKEEASNEFWPFIIELFATNINHLLPKAHPHIAIKKLNSKETLFILAIKKFVMKVGCCCNWHLPKMVVTSLVTFTSSTFSDPSKYANINKPPNLDPDRKYIPSMGYKVLLVGFVPKKTWDACVLNGVANWTEEKEPWKLALQSTLLREGGGLQNISSSMSLE